VGVFGEFWLLNLKERRNRGPNYTQPGRFL
jgi:hypothetical protein